MESIINALRAIEKQKGITILFACETGSRGWGFPSPDSDFDVRFIYRHDRDWYLQLGTQKDTIDTTIENDLDITGWDLRKSMEMMKRSNAALIERFQTPIVYYAAPGFKESFLQLVQDYYSPRAVFYHHLSLFRKLWDELQDASEMKLKSYFYLLRSLLSCYWIIKNSAVVPMTLEELMTTIPLSQRDHIRTLVQLKATVGEKYLHPRDRKLDQWIQQTLEEIDLRKSHTVVNDNDYQALNKFFLNALR